MSMIRANTCFKKSIFGSCEFHLTNKNIKNKQMKDLRTKSSVYFCKNVS